MPLPESRHERSTKRTRGAAAVRDNPERTVSAAARWPARWLQRWRRSLGLKLVLLFVLLAVAMSVIFSVGMRTALGSSWRNVIAPLVSDYVDHLAADIGSPPDLARARELTERLPLSIQIRGPVLNWQSAGAHGPAAVDEAAHEPGAKEALPREPARPDSDPRRDWLRRSTADGHQIVFGLDARGWMEAPRRTGWITLALLLLLTALTWWVVHRLFRPLTDIGAGAQRFGRGEFGELIPVRRPDELGELAGRVNTMALDLSRMLDGQRSLLLAISHELRSPLTRARLNAELVAEGPERDALLRDLGQMRDLISDLLENERLSQPHAPLQREPTDLAGLLQSVCSGTLAELPLTLDLPPDLPSAQVDRSRLALLLRNLLDNARRHGAGTPVLLRARFEAGELHLTVRDHGPGVPAAQLKHLSEPFFRPDAARQRATGGVGLGLSLCRKVAEAHGGSLSFANAQPGLEVSLQMPWPACPATGPLPA